MAVYTQEGHTATISQPPMLSWSVANHAAFPLAFRQQTAQLLRCWRRLSSGGGGSGSSSCAASLGSLPIELVSCWGVEGEQAGEEMCRHLQAAATLG